MDTTVINDNPRSLKESGHLSSRGILIVLSPNFFGRTFIVDRDSCILGRSDNADFSIKDDLISREHCRIIREEGKHFSIEDLQSTNSSSINGRKLKKKQQLCYGDRIRLGSTVMRFFREEEVS
ncbi:MAG: FHA domain-containing protein [Spirochaetales bacterium]|nr:FHA domain-containing protein [Spirochaetales bacterium]